LRVLDHDTTTKEVSDMMNVITRRPTRLAAAAAISTLALATPTLAASAHVPCGKHKAHHTNCGKHLGASKGKKKGHSK
jgi:hypothetical protein